MSDALLRHNYHLLINPLWSPLYPFLIGVTTWLVRPSAQWELPILHVVNFVIFLGVLASFEFLLRQVISVLGRENGPLNENSVGQFAAWRWQLLGYGLFAWSTFVLISVRIASPDLCVAMFVYLDAGLLLRLRTGTKGSRTCVLLGLTLGLGYLAKAILFPMAFVFMAVAVFMFGEWRKAILPLAMTLGIFCAVAAPLSIGISRMTGKPSFSEAGSLNYAWHVDGVESIHFYSSSPPSYLKHPLTLLHERPDIFGFRESLTSTYPPYFDAQYWNAGLRTVFKPLLQLRAIGGNLASFCEIPLSSMWVLIVAGLVLLLMSGNVSRRFHYAVCGIPLIIPGVLGTCSLLLVWIEPRYVASFLVLIFLGFFPVILVQKPNDPGK